MWSGFMPPLKLAEALLELAVCARPRPTHVILQVVLKNGAQWLPVLGTLAYSVQDDVPLGGSPRSYSVMVVSNYSRFRTFCGTRVPFSNGRRHDKTAVLVRISRQRKR